MKENYIHGKKVYYEENAAGGSDYLENHLDSAEAKVFFDQAKSKGRIKFEDASNRNYTLSRKSDGTYIIERRG